MAAFCCSPYAPPLPEAGISTPIFTSAWADAKQDRKTTPNDRTPREKPEQHTFLETNLHLFAPLEE